MTTGADRPVSARAGDAFEPLYSRYVRDVYRYSLALLGNRADAEDATQTAFLNAYRAYRRGERPREPLNWLIVIAHNACLERRRRALRRPQEVPLDVETGAADAVDRDVTQEVRELLDALAQLPFRQRAALVLREVGGRSYEEIAEILGTSVKAVDMALMRARQALRKGWASLGILSTVETPARLSGEGAARTLASTAAAGAPLAKVAALGGPSLLLTAKAVAVLAAGVVASAPIPGSGPNTSAVAAVRSVDAPVARSENAPLVAKRRWSFARNPHVSLRHPGSRRVENCAGVDSGPSACYSEVLCGE